VEIICFPFERVVEINIFILEGEPDMKGTVDVTKLQGALGRIDHALFYDGLDDIFEIAAKYFQENSSILSPKYKPLVSNDGQPQPDPMCTSEN
jgi:death-on-curing protein